jgi:predicted PurR-regulated permease PerM
MLVMIALGFIYSLGLWIIGLEFALVIGFIAGLVSFVPYLGFVVGILAAGVAMLFQTQDPLQLVPVAIVFTVGQLIEGMLLTPNLVGDRIRLHPVAVIFAVLAGGQLFGFVGVLVALPVAAVLAVIVRHLHEQYRASPLYGPQGPLSGDED